MLIERGSAAVQRLLNILNLVYCIAAVLVLVLVLIALARTS